MMQLCEFVLRRAAVKQCLRCWILGVGLLKCRIRFDFAVEVAPAMFDVDVVRRNISQIKNALQHKACDTRSIFHC